MGAVSSYCSRGYPCFRVPTVALGPTSGDDASLRWGQSLIVECSANPPSVTPTVMCVPAAD
jgi:hypothetical protein